MRFTSPLLLCAIALALAAGSLPGSAAPVAGQPGAVQTTAAEARFVALANAEREQHGLRALALDPLLVRVARAHSQEMCDKKYFAHQSPTAGVKSPMDRYLKGGGSFRQRLVVGENLYYCLRASVERGHAAFMASPSHRRNILSAEWEQMGVGVCEAPDGRFWVTEVFLLKR